MVIFVVTSEGFYEMEPLIKTGNFPVWLNHNVLSVDQIQKLRADNLNVTTFSYLVDSKNDIQFKEAIETIKEHHPNERVWTECQ